jgi:predicted permease
MLSNSMLLASLAWVGLPALVFQGLAAAHRSKAKGSLNQGWLAAIYVLLVVPLSNSVTILALAVWGFIDNWRKPKAQGV